jgi:hypothetical protein
MFYAMLGAYNPAALAKYVISITEDGEERNFLAEAVTLSAGVVTAVVNGNEIEFSINCITDIIFVERKHAPAEDQDAALVRLQMARTLQILEVLAADSDSSPVYH